MLRTIPAARFIVSDDVAQNLPKFCRSRWSDAGNAERPRVAQNGSQRLVELVDQRGPEVKESQARNTTLIGRMVRRSLNFRCSYPRDAPDGDCAAGLRAAQEVLTSQTKKNLAAVFLRLHLVTIA